jgi:hypothetical protein
MKGKVKVPFLGSLRDGNFEVFWKLREWACRHADMEKTAVLEKAWIYGNRGANIENTLLSILENPKGIMTYQRNIYTLLGIMKQIRLFHNCPSCHKVVRVLMSVHTRDRARVLVSAFPMHLN